MRRALRAGGAALGGLVSLLVVVSGCAGGAHPAATDPSRIRRALSLPAVHAAELAPRFEESWRRRDAVIERVSFQGKPGVRIPALVAYSDLAATRPLPVILCMPGSPNRKEDLLQPLDLLGSWAQAGFFVLTIDRPYHGERPGDPETAIRDKGLPRVLGEYVHDLVRALDYAASRPEADGERIGMLGLSMGGMEALLLAAVDARVGCVVSVSGQLSWEDIFAGDAWKLIFTGLPLTQRLRAAGAGPDGVRSAFLEQTPQLAALDAPAVAATLAPRPLLLMTGADDPYVSPAAARRTHTVAAAAYGRHRERLALWVESGVGHSFSRPMEARALAWFQRWLQATPAAP